MDPIPDPLFLKNSGTAENRTRDLWISSQQSDHWITEAVRSYQQQWKIYRYYNQFCVS
jgi:hypothetical protein